MPMPDDPFKNAVEIFSTPIEGLIVALGKGIAEAQTALDQHSIKMQETIDSDPMLSRQGLQATWYQFPKVELQLKMALTVVEEKSSSPSSIQAAPLPIAALAVRRLIAQPVSAAYQNHFNYDAQASSLITLSIVPVPPPRAGDQTTLSPRMSPEEVQKVVFASSAQFVTVMDNNGNKIPTPALRFDLTLQGQSA
jgi:hypothetical protein